MASPHYFRIESKSVRPVLKILKLEFLSLNLQPATSSTCYQAFCQNPLLLEANRLVFQRAVIVSPMKDYDGQKSAQIRESPSLSLCVNCQIRNSFGLQEG